MAKVVDASQYSTEKEIPLSAVTAGHTILLQSPEGNIVSYVVCKIGNTALSINDQFKQITLLNLVTGRLVLKNKEQMCNKVSSIVNITNFKRENNNDQEQNFNR